MQKDVHFYLTYALARHAGVKKEDAVKIAWADQFTDDLTRATLYGIQTQSAILGNWSDRQIQLTVIIPFHFLPGDDPENPWVTTQNNSRAKAMVKAADRDLFKLGIALHCLQDTFSHQGFSGWEEKSNGRYLFWYIANPTPNVGHADLGPAPDIVNYIWTDPKTGQVIHNHKRAFECAKTTFECLFFDSNSVKGFRWNEIIPILQAILAINSYDKRKEELRKLAGDKQIRYSQINQKFSQRYGAEFVSAARVHLGRVMESITKINKTVKGQENGRDKNKRKV